jgi:hypothetical protein
MRTNLVLLIVLIVLAAVPARAQSVVSDAERVALRGVPETWGFSLGGFAQAFDSRIRLDGKYGEAGTTIDLEQDLGLPSQQNDLNLKAFYRLSDRSQLRFDFLAWSRSSTRVLEREIRWDDKVYEVGAQVDAQGGGQMYNLIYQYSFFNNGKVNFGLDGGLSTFNFDTKLTRHVSVGEGGTGVTQTEVHAKVLPVPVIGAHFEMTLVKRLFWRANAYIFDASVAGYDVKLWEAWTSVDYFVTRNVGLGAGFAATAADIYKTGTHGGNWYIRYSYSGLVAYALFVF